MKSEELGQIGEELRGETPRLAFAPPTVPGPLGRPPRQVAWPAPIGIIAIVFGAVGALMSVYGAVMPWMMSSWSFYTPGTAKTFDPFAAMRHWALWLSVVNGIGVLVAAMLLAGGIGLLMRRAWGATLLVAWAIVRIPFAVALTFLTVVMQQEQMEGMASQTGTPFGTAFVSGFAWFGAIISLAWYGALPTFMLIWFTRTQIRKNVEAWRIGGARVVAAGDPGWAGR